MLAAAFVGGCASVFGLDPVDDVTITGTWLRQYAFNNANHTPVTEARPYSSSELFDIEVRTEEDAAVDIDFDYATGAFSFRAPATRYRLKARRQSGQLFELQSSAPELAILDTAYVRPNTIAAGPGTRITGTITPAAPYTHLVTTGVWTLTALPEAPGSYDLSWENRGLLSAAGYDRIYFTRFSTLPEALDASVVVAAGTIDVEMADRIATTANVTLSPIAQPYCVNVKVARRAELARITARHPDLTENDVTAWNLYASPDLDLGVGMLFFLAVGNNACEDCTVRYATPFAGFRTVGNLGAQRQLTLPDPYRVTRFAGITLFKAIEDSITCEPYVIEGGQVAIPANFHIDGRALVVDGDMLASRGKLVEVTWDSDAPAEMYQVLLVEAVAPGMTSNIIRIITTEPRALVDAALLKSGHAYYFQVGAYVGFPNASSGDFAVVTYPYAGGYGSSPLFVVP